MRGHLAPAGWVSSSRMLRPLAHGAPPPLAGAVTRRSCTLLGAAYAESCKARSGRVDNLRDLVDTSDGEAASQRQTSRKGWFGWRSTSARLAVEVHNTSRTLRVRTPEYQ